MPWAKYFIDKSHPRVYLNLIDSLLDRITGDKELLVRSLYIRTELLKHDFTKRQRNIINFIFTSSYIFGQKTAVIPRLSDFSLCGIQSFKAKSQLQELVDMGVITWSKETNEFGIADPRGWEAPINHMFNSDRARELFILNLKHAGIDVDSIIKMSLEDSDNF